MATWNAWATKCTALDLETTNTFEIYSQIKQLGLKSVDWEEFNPKVQTLDEIKSKVTKFVKDKGPCLFIWDPHSKKLKKDYLINQYDDEKIINWLNSNNLKDYRIAITTQVVNKREGFVGTNFSDGKGRVLCETMLKSGIEPTITLKTPSNSTDCKYEIRIA